MNSLPRRLAVDVLVLGAGLAGLRAAVSCLEASPGLSLAVASLTDSPAGSSFANQNNALGMHVCLNDSQRQAYLAEVLDLAGGALLDPELVAIQAQEGQARFQELLALGLSVKRHVDGSPMAHPSCFSPHSRRAYIFTDLARAYHVFRRRLEALGGRFVSGLVPAALLRDPQIPGGPCLGALLMPQGSGESLGRCMGESSGAKPLAVSAKAVVAALGGPGRLFAHFMAGPGVPGYGHGLLAQAGARLANAGYLQFMWGHVVDRTFWTPAALGPGGYRVLARDGRDIPLSELVADLPGLAAQRLDHCPFGYGLADAALDLALAEHMDTDGCVAVRDPQGNALRLAPMAHASNGGAKINPCSETSVPGLLACGECATGMHGANRLGGAMVLATQVFGHRAGHRAAGLARELPAPQDGRFRDLARDSLEKLALDEPERLAGLEELARELSRYAALGGRPGSGRSLDRLRLARQAARDWRLAASQDTALALLDGLPWPEGQNTTTQS